MPEETLNEDWQNSGPVQTLERELRNLSRSPKNPAKEEIRKASAQWIKDTMEKWSREDRWALTISLGKGVSLSRLRDRGLLGSKDAKETLSGKIEHLIRRLITWIENTHHLKTFAFYVLPTGPFGNRHVHIALMGEGLANASLTTWENRLKHALRWYCPNSTAHLSNADGGWADYMTSSQNFVGELQTRGCLPK